MNFQIEEAAPFGAVTAYRGLGAYLRRTEHYDKSIKAYNEAVKWHNKDVRALLGRSLSHSKTTNYVAALQDVYEAIAIDPDNITAKQIQAQTQYEKCNFEKALVLAHQGKRIRKYPSDFAECARHAEETIRGCTARCARKVLLQVPKLLNELEQRRLSVDEDASGIVKRVSRMKREVSGEAQEITFAEQQKFDHISRLMSSKYLERMAHDKYFLISLCKDKRIYSANKQGSQNIQELANKALADLIKCQDILRERLPMYAATLTEKSSRLKLAKKEHLLKAKNQNITDVKRLINIAKGYLDETETAKCIENAIFGMQQIIKKPANLLPNKDKYLQELYGIVGNAFLDQKRIAEDMNENDSEKRAFVLLGLALSREPSRDNILKVRPEAPPRDVVHRLHLLERSLKMSTRASERCYLLHELARHHADTRKGLKACFYAVKCQTEARVGGQNIWLLNAKFLLARGHILQNNRLEARATLLEGASYAKMFRYHDVARFFETCAVISTEGELPDESETVEKREKEMVALMPDEELRTEAKHLFVRMSAIPTSRRFSVMPGVKIEDTGPPSTGRRISIMPKTNQPVTIARKHKTPLGFQVFD